MYENRFSSWHLWHDRKKIAGMDCPGVYAIAISKKNLSGTPFSWRQEIIYVGMTNAAAGLSGRLKQFDNTINGKRGHGGADRVRFKHRDYDVLTGTLFVAVASFKCDATSNLPEDLRVLGSVAKFEYDCFAQFAEKFGRLPEFNDKKGTQKYSLTVGRGR